jgi:hypothetical protein
MWRGPPEEKKMIIASMSTHSLALGIAYENAKTTGFRFRVFKEDSRWKVTRA